MCTLLYVCKVFIKYVKYIVLCLNIHVYLCVCVNKEGKVWSLNAIDIFLFFPQLFAMVFAMCLFRGIQ